MIQVEQLTKRYPGRVAVDGVSFEVRSGEVVGFLGPNGAGKTTTLRVVAGYLPPTAGRVRLDGIDVALRPVEARRRIGYLPEGVPLHPELRVREYLAFRARLKGVARRRATAEIERSLAQASVTDARDRLIGQLSKGTRQRVGLADALLGDPPILILDEPTSGLDPHQIREIRALVRSFEGKKTVLLSTHLLPEVEATCSRVVIVDRGKKVGEGTPRALRGGDDGRVLELVGRGTSDAFRVALEAVPEVRRVERIERVDAGDDVVRVELVVVARDDAAEAVFHAVAAAGLSLRELRTRVASLEETFVALTGGPRPAAGREPGLDEDERGGGAS